MNMKWCVPILQHGLACEFFFLVLVKNTGSRSWFPSFVETSICARCGIFRAGGDVNTYHIIITSIRVYKKAWQ